MRATPHKVLRRWSQIAILVGIALLAVEVSQALGTDDAKLIAPASC